MRIAKACCAFSNVLGLPLPLVQSIVAGLAAYASDEEAQSRCISYLFLANIASSTCMWSLTPMRSHVCTHRAIGRRVPATGFGSSGQDPQTR